MFDVKPEGFISRVALAASGAVFHRVSSFSLVTLAACIFLSSLGVSCSSAPNKGPAPVAETVENSEIPDENAYKLGADLEIGVLKAEASQRSYKDSRRAAPQIRSQRLIPLGIGADGFPKIKRYFKTRGSDQILEKVETDFNSDGQIDMIQWYDLTGQYVAKEAVDFNGTGKLALISYYKKLIGAEPELIKQEIDSRLEGRISVWKTFKNNKLVRRDIDRRGRGRPDYWEYYDNATLLRVERDENGDGIPDSQPRFRQVVKPTTPEKALKAPAKLR